MRSLFLVLTALSVIIAAPLPQSLGSTPLLSSSSSLVNANPGHLDGSNGLGLSFFSQPLLLAADTEEPAQQPAQQPVQQPSEQQPKQQPEQPQEKQPKGGEGDQIEDVIYRNGPRKFPSDR